MQANNAGTLSSCEGSSQSGGAGKTPATYWIRTYGCQMNVHDSEIYAGQMRRLGLVPVDSPEDADVVLLNTCSVREKGEDNRFVLPFVQFPTYIPSATGAPSPRNTCR